MSELIDKQVAIEAYGDWYVEEGTEEGFIGTVKQLLEELPPVPERTGHWIYDGFNYPHGIEWCHCSQCGNRESVDSVYTHVDAYPYCARCGAHMIEEVDG